MNGIVEVRTAPPGQRRFVARIGSKAVMLRLNAAMIAAQIEVEDVDGPGEMTVVTVSTKDAVATSALLRGATGG